MTAISPPPIGSVHCVVPNTKYQMFIPNVEEEEGEKQVSFYIYIYPFFDFFFCHEKWK